MKYILLLLLLSRECMYVYMCGTTQYKPNVYTVWCKLSTIEL